jgi:2-polyprenyl-6-methoxyphenol hydroxylase-like FAD-dependent oxidoreductase
VPPTADRPEQSNEFKYGRLEGRTPTLEEFNALIRETMGPEHYTEVLEPTWLTYFTVQERMVEDLRMAQRLFLAGDAAHCHSPAGGQGMNLGIQDGISAHLKFL